MNERDSMHPNTPAATAARSATAEPDRTERFIRSMCRRAHVSYDTVRNPQHWAEAMRRRLADGDEATARLDCVIFASLIQPGMSAAGATTSMKRAVRVREELRECDYWLVRPVSARPRPPTVDG